MLSELCPEYLFSLIPPSVGNNTTYNLRNSKNLQTMHSNVQLYYKSFLPSVIRDWNDLPQEIHNSNSLSRFKHKPNADLNMPPSFYKGGKRLGQIYHARLRTQCSSLNHHLYLKILDLNGKQINISRKTFF